ncbi:MAG: hydrolase [Bacteroidia bacterium]|nr:hydrolase [Bacteroidia bacterium]
MIDRKHTLLLVVDIQGKLAEIAHESAHLLRNARILIEGAKILGIPIVYTEQYPKGLGPTESNLAELLADAIRIEKDSFSCCGAFEFEVKLTELHKTDILLCGIEAHVCVYQTARDLIGLGYNVHVVSDAVSSRTPANRELGIHAMEQLGAKRTGTEMALFELLQVSGTDEFKAISRLVK